MRHGYCPACDRPATYRITSAYGDEPLRPYVIGADNTPSYSFACDDHRDERLSRDAVHGFRSMAQPFVPCGVCNGTGQGSQRVINHPDGRVEIRQDCATCGWSGEA